MRKKILVADDSITIQKVVELTFSEDEYEVTGVANGAQAWERISKDPPDIALLDVIMPELDGYQICSRMKKSEPTSWVPVLLLTGSFEPFDEARAREAGADGHLKKPFESRALVARVRELMAARSRPGSPVEEERPAPSAVATASATAPSGGLPPARQPAGTAGVPPEQLFRKVPPGPPPGRPAPQPQAGRAAAPAGNGAPKVSVPPEVIERAVRAAVADISEKIVREVAWEVIPDLAESIIRRRIRELEDEAQQERG